LTRNEQSEYESKTATFTTKNSNRKNTANQTTLDLTRNERSEYESKTATFTTKKQQSEKHCQPDQAGFDS
jgi:hypothetical protein